MAPCRAYSTAPGRNRTARGSNLNGHLTRQRHFARVTDQPEAGDIRASVDVEGEHRIASFPVELQHLLNGGVDIRLFRDSLLQGRRDYAGANAFGEDQRIPRLVLQRWSLIRSG